MSDSSSLASASPTTDTMIPKVSVCIIAYNHEGYIEQALLSALTQVTDFEFEVIVCDDASTDGTLEIIRRIESRHPNLRVFAHPANIGGSQNYLFAHNAARGEYVAHLDGDDFWLPGKLQAQATFLDAHPECVIVWHPVIAFDEQGTHYIAGDHGALLRRLFGKEHVQLDDAILAYGTTGFHSSNMYRRSARTMRSYPAPELLLDYRLSLSLLEQGVGYHMRRPFGCYRVFHSNSATRGERDFVGPGLLRALNDYSASHSHLKSRVAAHCVAALVGRVRFQAKLVGLLVSRLGGSRSSPTGQKPSIFIGKQPLRKRLEFQVQYSKNSVAFLACAIRQLSRPHLRDIKHAVQVSAYLSRPKQSKPDFFRRRYGKPV